ncbi:SAM-dependent methyltransferase, partial [Bacillus vallismortis]|nr:SAM-dependent methyltransferase [Bacillus vallismortis]
FVAGEFLACPVPPFQAYTIVSSSAFHHLTEEEKRAAIKQYGKYLHLHDRIVFADTVFEDVKAYEQAIDKASSKGFYHLAKDVET